MSELRLEGSLGDTSLAKLMYSICRTGETGTLYLTRGTVSASLYVSKGQVVFAASNDPDTRLGELLLRDGQITYAQYEEAAGKLRPGKRFGAVLVELGYISSQELYHYVIEQVKQVILGLFLWTEGKYRFEIGSLPSKEVVTLNISTGDLIIEGIKRVQQWSRVHDAVGKLDSLYEPAADMEEKIKGVFLTQGERALLNSIKEHKTLGAILNHTQYPDLEVCRLLWAFQIIGAVNHKEAMEAEVDDLLGEALSSGTQDSEQKAPQVSVTLPPQKSLSLEEAEEVSEAVPKKEGKIFEAVDAEKDENAEFQVELAQPVPPPPSSEKAPSVGAKPAASKGKSPLTQKIEDAVAGFNKKHAYLFSVLKAELADGYLRFVEDAAARMDRRQALVFDGARPDAEGRYSADTLVKNVKGNSITDFAEALDGLIQQELEALKTLFNNPMRFMIVQKGLKRIEENAET